MNIHKYNNILIVDPLNQFFLSLNYTKSQWNYKED